MKSLDKYWKSIFESKNHGGNPGISGRVLKVISEKVRRNTVKTSRESFGEIPGKILVKFIIRPLKNFRNNLGNYSTRNFGNISGGVFRIFMDRLFGKNLLLDSLKELVKVWCNFW